MAARLLREPTARAVAKSECAMVNGPDRRFSGPPVERKQASLRGRARQRWQWPKPARCRFAAAGHRGRVKTELAIWRKSRRRAISQWFSTKVRTVCVSAP